MSYRNNSTISYNPYESFSGGDSFSNNQSLSSYGYGFNQEKGFGSGTTNTGSDSPMGSGGGGGASSPQSYANVAQGAMSIFELAKSNLDTSEIDDLKSFKSSKIQGDDEPLKLDTSFHKANLAQIGSIDTSKPEYAKDYFVSEFKGATEGASAGSSFGPYGALIGGIIGGVTGGSTSLIGNKKRRKAARRKKAELERKAAAQISAYTRKFDKKLEERHLSRFYDERRDAIMNRYNSIPYSMNDLI